jgi:serine/threonine protein kinase
MARVYLAIQTSLERRVALKVMAPALAADASFSKRFMREARTIASLTHPNIVSVYEVGVTVDHMHYFSMQYLPGGDFAQRMRKNVSQAEIVRVLTGIAKALGFAHQQGVIHRDVTPGNIMFDSADTPQLTDFGIARALSGSTRITSTGVSIGTSNYMSPEQARGGEVDARSDLYSLGALAFEALTGRTPYQGPDGFAVAYAHVFEPIPRLPPQLKHWQTFIDKALAKEPKDRFADGEDLINGLLTVSIPTDSTALEPVPADTVEPPKSTTKLIENLARQIGTATTRAPRPTPPWGRLALVAILVGGIALAAYGVLAPKPNGATGTPALAADPPPKPPIKPPPPVAPPSEASVAPIAPTTSTAPVAVAGTDTTAAGVDNFGVPPLVAGTPGDPAPMDTNPTVDGAVLGPDGLPVAEAGQPSADGAIVAPIDYATVSPELWGPPTVQAQIQILLDLGQALLRMQRLLLPAEANATLIFKTVLQLDPKNEAAKKGLTAVVDAYLLLANTDLDAGKIAEGKDRLDKARQVAVMPGLDNAVLTAKLDLAWSSRGQVPKDAARTALAAWQGDAALVEIEKALAYMPGDKELLAWQREAKVIGKPGYVFRDGAGNPEMIIVGTGQPYAVGRREVSVGEFRRFVEGSGKNVGGGCKNEDGGLFTSLHKDWSWRSPGFTQGADHPVVCIGYDDAVAYANWLSKASGQRYRLLSEAEWQSLAGKVKVSACKTGNRADLSYQKKEGGNDSQPCDDGYFQTAPGGRFLASAPGVYDLEGNVREWVACDSCGKKRLVLGSAWHSDRDEAAVSVRRLENGDWMSNVLGFRVARELALPAKTTP